jgi:hypothetical protein
MATDSASFLAGAAEKFTNRIYNSEIPIVDFDGILVSGEDITV